MRTTLTLEADLAAKLKELSRQKRTSFKQEVNDAIRAGLAVLSKPRNRDQPFQVEPSHCGFRPGVDTGRLNQLLDEIEAEEFRTESGRGL